MVVRAVVTGFCLCVISISGCAAFDSKVEALSENNRELLDNVKSIKGTGATTGLSREAREIENSLNGF
jgi:hypothetical protein